MKNPTLAFAVALAAGLLGGCQSGENLSATGKLAVEPVSTEQVRVVWAEVWQEGQDVVVRGRLTRNEPAPGTLRGHVDVRFLDQAGQVVRQAASQEVCVCLSAPATGTRWAPFEVRLAYAPPAGGKAVVAFHAGPHQD